MFEKVDYRNGVEKTDDSKPRDGKDGLGSKCLCVVTSMFRGFNVGLLWSVVGFVVLTGSVGGSEFPERECCDPVYPPNTATTAAAPVTHPVSKPAGKLIVQFSNLS